LIAAPISGKRETNDQKLHTPQGNHGERLIHLWTAAIQSGHRAATQSTSSADLADLFGGGAAVVGGAGASSGRFAVVAQCFCTV